MREGDLDFKACSLQLPQPQRELAPGGRCYPTINLIHREVVPGLVLSLHHPTHRYEPADRDPR